MNSCNELARAYAEDRTLGVRKAVTEAGAAQYECISQEHHVVFRADDAVYVATGETEHVVPCAQVRINPPSEQRIGLLGRSSSSPSPEE